MTTYVVGGGCFWCLDAVFRRVRGVTSVVSGYAGGSNPHPTYEQVSSGTTGHAEVVQVQFDETVLPEATFLDLFFASHDPITLNRQGADVGTQYRSIIFYLDPQQQQAAQTAVARAAPHWDAPIVTAIEPLETFWPAEEYHQDYFSKAPEAGYCQAVINPKLTRVRAQFNKLFKKETSA